MTDTLPTPITSTLEATDQKTVGVALQDALADLVDLSLLGKQAHWNVVGRHFRELHLQLDELVDTARGYVDDVAERASALGISPDGRASTVAAHSGLPDFSEGYVPDARVVELIVSALDTSVRRLREHIRATETADPVTQDLFIQVAAGLEKARWMFQAQLTD